MSDLEPKTPPAPKRQTGRIVGLALLAGLAAGAFGVYVMETRSGNSSVASTCPAKDGLRQALDGAARGEVAAVVPLDQPFDVSTIAFKDGNDQPTSLGAMKGQSLLVNLWATWCAPCRAEMPALDQLERQAGDESFAVVPINIDMGDVAKPKAFYAETNLTALPFFRDETMGVFNDLKKASVAVGLPVTLLVDADGCARAAINGPAHWSSPDALALVDVLKGAGGGSAAAPPQS
ncbi:thiol:disulfide interchange protein TlpA [Aureimonas sp. AU40]|uniref:thiol:disulfide interchange protein TlpA n=1 Tax=Aureimonas sp. AU40 TaxID=1637747 RepID=UPI0007831BD3|nr:TlpA disulfide reductase family protein [Aureimonas sp. AU40]